MRRDADNGPLFPRRTGGGGGGQPPPPTDDIYLAPYEVTLGGKLYVFRMLDGDRFRQIRKGRNRRCPTCIQTTEDRLRGLTGKEIQALATIAMQVRTSIDGFVHIRDVHRAEIGDGEMGGDYAKLRYWQLIREDEGRRGVWTVTRLGLAFLDGEVKLPKYVALAEYRETGKVLGYAYPLVSVMDVLPEKFDLDKLRDNSRPGKP
jgi:hypothetical protein